MWPLQLQFPMTSFRTSLRFRVSSLNLFRVVSCSALFSKSLWVLCGGGTGSMKGLVASPRVFMQRATFPTCCCQRPHPCGEPLQTYASTRDPPTLAGSFGSVVCGVSAPFLWVLVNTRFCLCPPRLESLFSPVLCKSYNQIPLVFKAKFPADS